MIMGFDRRPLEPGDAGAWAALLTAIQHADGSDRYASEQGLQEAFGQPDQDFASGSIAIHDGHTMVGYGVLTCRSVADPVHNMRHEGGVHPSYRGRGLGGELLHWAERTAVPLRDDRFPGRPLSLSSGCLSRNAGAVALHEHHGFQPVRWFHSMVRVPHRGFPGPARPP
jgi:GNAT superfamily N-acetyltransferase